jgi:hypothetical protein
MPELALDDVDRDSFARELDGMRVPSRELDGMRVPQLMGREPPPYTGVDG